MATYRDVMNRQDDDAGWWKDLLRDLENEYPNIRDMFTGFYNDLGDQTTKSASVTFWLDRTKLKFVIRPKDGTLLGWGVCSDVCNPWRSIELAMLGDQIDWKEGLNKSSDGAPY